jgi:hypothetical protein
MTHVAVPFGVAGGLGAFSAYGWWWVGILVFLGMVAGAGIGWFPSLLTLPLAATSASRVSSGRDVVAYGVSAEIGLFSGAELARQFKADRGPSRSEVPNSDFRATMNRWTLPPSSN